MKLVAVTSCPTGIAHSQMAAEGLEQAAESLGHDIRVEIQGAMGAEDELTSEEIAEADAVIIAADTSVSRDRFQDKPLVKAAVAKAINEGEDLIEEAVAKAGGEASEAESPSDESDASSTAKKSESTTESTANTSSESTPESATTGEQSSQSEQKGLLGKLRQLFS
ncbi:MAG: PTS fructose transporter subunit IIB [Halapricum sp.]